MTVKTLRKEAEGYIDGVIGGKLVGWAWFASHPETVATVEVIIKGVVITTLTAERYRKDLDAAGKRAGFCGFEVAIRDLLLRESENELEVRVLGGALLQPGRIRVPGASQPSRAAPHKCGNELPARLEGPGIEGHLDTFGPDFISGWIWRPANNNELIQLSVVMDGCNVLTFAADGWRQDLAEMRQGDGRGAFKVDIPEALCDGRLHKIDMRLGDTGSFVLSRPLELRFEPRPPTKNANSLNAKVEPAAAIPAGIPEISFIVNFYNMQREAVRTLQSLSRAYQQGVEGRAYEVLCIDNGSKPPMDPVWVESFGREFRLIRPRKTAPSPCSAINEATRAAKGHHLAIMIDGAHVLTPGVFREAFEAIDADADAIVAVRYWFVGGDQRWLGEAGYSREIEDMLFAKIRWPSNGYELFGIGMPIGEAQNCWLEGSIESNCLFLPASLYHRLGGMDERFSEPGAGYANLDLFKRAADTSDGPLVCLVGEASFHQFHEGTTTNVTEEDKDVRVRTYAQRYRRLRGEQFKPVPPERIKLRGTIRTPRAMDVRQRPAFAAAVGVTDRVRPAILAKHADFGTRLYFNAVGAENAKNTRSLWLGQEFSLSPADLLSIQDLIRRVKPTRVVTTSRDDGLLVFVESVLTLLGLEESRILRALPSAPAHAGRLQDVVIGDPFSKEMLEKLEALLGAEEAVIVLFSPAAEDYLPVEALKAYSRFVSFGSYLVYLGTAFGQPWLGYSKRWPRKAIGLFLSEDRAFEIDNTVEPQLGTFCPDGYLQRVRHSQTSLDFAPALDDLDGL